MAAAGPVTGCAAISDALAGGDRGCESKVVNPVVQSCNQAAVFVTRSELDEFLFAPVIDDGTGMTLSVLSMLARAGVDPRSKAAELAGLPQGKAIAALTSLIDELPRDLMPRCETGTVAARLVTLLPHRTARASTPSQAPVGGAPLTRTHAIAIAAILACFLMGAVWLTASREASMRGGGPAPQASAAVVAHASSPSAATPPEGRVAPGRRPLSRN